MALASSIGKQIAPGVYEDLNKKKTIPQNTGINVDQSQALYGAGLSAPQTPAPTTSSPDRLGQPKVATKANPVISRDTPTLPTEPADVTAIKNMGFEELSDYITKTQVYGIDTTNKDEMYKLAIAQQRIQQLGMPQAPQATTDAETQRREEQARRDLEYQLHQTKTQNISDYERFLNDQYRMREGELQKGAEQEMSAAQNVLSFSGFGRSSFAAEKMSEIQGVYNAQKNLLLQENQIALSKYKAEQEGASAETLAAYDSQISALKQKEAEYLAETAKQVNEYNAQYAQTLQEKLDNIMQTSAIYDDSKLTEEQLALADTYAQFLVGDDGQINDTLMKQIPAQLVGASLKRAVKVRQDMMTQGQGFSFQKMGDNTLARINDKTGEVEFLVGPEAQSVVNNLPSGTPIPQGDWSQVIDTNTDLSTIPELVQKAAVRGEASVKNNNPSGVTWGFSPRLRQAFIDAGINFGQGTQRPSGEGGSYVKFATVGDGLNAHYIVLSQTGRTDVYDRLYAWSAGGDKNTPQPTKLATKRKYAEGLMAQAGIKKGTKFSELTQDQVDKLVKAHITRESPVFAGAVFGGGAKQPGQAPTAKDAYLARLRGGKLTPSEYTAIQKTAEKEGRLQEYMDALSGKGGETKAGYDINKAPDYVNYIEKGKLPTGIKSGTEAYENFIAQAGEGYIASKQKELSQKGFTIQNPEAFKNVDSKTMEAVNKAIAQVPAFEQAMDDIISIVDEYGTELPFTAKGREIRQKIKNAQLIAKEIYNLGVLNGPDLSLMESIIANPAGNWSKLGGAFVDYKDLLEKGKETILGNAYAQARSIGLAPVSQGVKYEAGKKYNPGTIIVKDGKRYFVGNDGNFYEQ